MASKRQRKNGLWEYRFERKGLLQRTYRTFETEAEGDAYALQAEKLLATGVIPPELTTNKFSTVSELLNLYEVRETLAPSSKGLLSALHNTVGSVKLVGVNNEWLDNWIVAMQSTLAPSSLKKRVELLARCIDWAMRKDLVTMNKNPMRSLPKGYASKGIDRYSTWAGQRDRRLSSDGAEERAIRSVLAEKGSPAEVMIFNMALESAMRMREMYTLSTDQVDVLKNTIFLNKTKNGSKRQVPMSSVLKALLVEHLATLEGDKLFPWWDGSLEVIKLDALSTRLSQRFARRFKQAGYPDLHFHDLRHEATSRIYERTTLSDLEVAKITGHTDLRMLARYANLRGSDLAAKLW